jgi:hypothetical protein
VALALAPEANAAQDMAAATVREITFGFMVFLQVFDKDQCF